MLLTKRIENYFRLTPWITVAPNVWLGITAENQHYYEQRWKILQTIDAPVRFISYEPAMGPLTKLRLQPGGPAPDWLICGGQSGGGALEFGDFRKWARDIRDLCGAEGVAFFMKQMPKKAPIPDDLRVRQFPTRRT